MRENIGNEILKKVILFKNDSKKINNMNLGLNKYYYSEIFNDYGLYLDLSFELEKNDSYIEPPNTGI